MRGRESLPSSLQGLKPTLSIPFTSGLRPRPPKESIMRRLLVGCRGGDSFFGLQPGAFDVPSEAEGLQGIDAVPVDVHLIPGMAVAGCLRLGMVVIVPAFAKRQDGNPEAVG